MTVAINGRFLVDAFGGVLRFATELTQRLAALRDDVVLVVPRSAAGAAPPGVRTVVVGRFSGPVWEQIELPLWLARHGRPLLVNLANIATVLYPRQISLLHDIAPAMRPGDFHPLFRAQWWLSLRLGMLRRGRTLVTISDASRDEIIGLLGARGRGIEVIHPGADSLDHGTARSGGGGRVVAFGRQGSAKNTRIVVDAAHTLPDDAIVIEFVGRLDPALQPYARASDASPGRFLFRGEVTDEDLASSLASASAFVWPSLHEGFGLPPLEAQTLGTPVIASDIPVNREILAESAVFFPPTDAEALAAAMTRVVSDDDLRAELSRRGAENAKRFTWSRTAQAWHDLIERHPS